jgi:di/tricarboxylate transporter
MGGYRFTDFARVGFPLTVVMLGVAAVVIPIFWPLS